MIKSVSSQLPAIILVEPQLGENIGAAARIMANFGLSELCLVAPRDPWPNPAAEAMGAGALEHIKLMIFDDLKTALADYQYVLATSARRRGIEKPIYGPAQAVSELLARKTRLAVMFGAEKSGLSNDDLALADGQIIYPVSPDFTSLNLAQAVAVFCYAWQSGQLAGEGQNKVDRPDASGLNPTEGLAEPAASRGELIGMMEHLEKELQSAGFFYPPEKTTLMIRNLRNAFVRTGWTAQEVKTFRGVIKALARGRGAARIDDKSVS